MKKPPLDRPDYTGAKFTVARYGPVVWKALYYHRGGNWVCEEPTHQTTCHFHESEIATGRQVEMPIDGGFALIVESADDGHRIAREKTAAREREEQAKRAQLSLF